MEPAIGPAAVFAISRLSGMLGQIEGTPTDLFSIVSDAGLTGAAIWLLYLLSTGKLRTDKTERMEGKLQAHIDDHAKLNERLAELVREAHEREARLMSYLESR